MLIEYRTIVTFRGYLDNVYGGRLTTGLCHTAITFAQVASRSTVALVLPISIIVSGVV